MRFDELPSPVQEALRRTGRDAKASGIRLFVFGSFARGDARSNSDLDLGFEAGPGVSERAVAHLRDQIEDLPTIRPVDLVDFRNVSDTFREHARTAILPLSE